MCLLQNLVLCFRLYFGKDPIVVNTAEATVKHLVSLVFDRVLAEDEQHQPNSDSQVNLEELKVPSNVPPKTLRNCAADAYLMFQVNTKHLLIFKNRFCIHERIFSQDLVQLVNSDQPYWLTGLTEMSKTFGLQLLESMLVKFPSVFFNV